MKKICVITGTRAEYGILYWLIMGLNEDPEIELQVIVTGMHLSPEFGHTWERIEEDGIPISKKIEILLSSDTAVGISKSMGLAQISFAEAFEDLDPDIIVILGDRTEVMAAATTALIANIPIAHIGGGELTEGAYDDSIRHCISKMSHLHFTSTEIYRNRVIQLGENPKYVYNLGALGLDNIRKLSLLSREEFEISINKKLLNKNLLITFHPVTLENNSAGNQFKQLLKALDELEDTLLIFTKPNSDKNGRVIIQLIDEYVAHNRNNSIAFTSLGQLRYISAIPFMDAIVGNSSSGIYEAPIFNVPTINIGDRQKGRIMGPSIINCMPLKDDIRKSLSIAFQYDKTNKWNHPYGQGDVSDKIIAILKQLDIKNIKKSFYDCN